MSIETKTKPSTTRGTRQTNLRHYVLLDPETREPADEALCGYMWDRLNVAHNGDICQECVELSKQIPRS
ncbi:MAG: hypothetical protein JKY65_11095 [Planctomycetes bacterium]|nr:hypothetical protein [Planctomycetota bacterium]